MKRGSIPLVVAGESPEALAERYERRLRDYVATQAELEQRVERMRLDLEEARERAERAERIRRDFLANVGHELRTPMNAIIGFCHLCLKTELQPNQRDYLQKLHLSANALLRLLNDMLDCSGIQAGRLRIEPSAFDLEDLLTGVESLMRIRATEKGLALRFERMDGLPEVLTGDSVRLGQILMNLVGNAVKFTERGEVVVEVARVGESDGAIRLCFTIRDTGIGMTPEQVAGLSGPFCQADSGATRRYGGLGLGLSIARSLVEMMRGSIRVESRAGIGSRFTVELECGKASAPGGAEPVAEESPLPSFSRGAGGGWSCLPLEGRRGPDVNRLLWEVLPGVPGISMRAGLRVMGGDLALFRRVLMKFFVSQADTGRQMAALIEARAWGELERVAFSLKGAAATIGAVALSAAAGEIEQATRAGVGRRRLRPLLAEVLCRLDAVLEAIGPALGGESCDAAVARKGEFQEGAPDRERLLPLLRQAERLLLQCDVGAEQVIRAIAPLVVGEEMRADWREIRRLLDRYDYETCLGVVQNWLGRLDGSPDPDGTGGTGVDGGG